MESIQGPTCINNFLYLMLHAKRVKQEVLLHSIRLKWDFAIPEMLERTGAHTPHSSHILVCPPRFWWSGGKSVVYHNLPAPSAETVTTSKLGTLGRPNPSLSAHAAFAGDQHLAVQGTQHRHARCSHELEHCDSCSAGHVPQEVWTQGTLINSQVLSEETEAAEASWLPKAKQDFAVLFILFDSSRVALCVLCTRSFTDTNNIPGPLLLFLVGVEPSLTNTRAAPPGWELDKAMSPEAELHPTTRSSLISSRITILRHNLVFGVEKKITEEMPWGSTMDNQCIIKIYYKASQAAAEQSYRTGTSHLGFIGMLEVQEELL